MAIRTFIAGTLIAGLTLMGSLVVPASTFGYVVGCNAWHYSNITYGPQRIYSFYSQSFINTTGQTGHTYTTQASNGGTVGIEFSAGGAAEAGVIFANVAATASVTVSASATVGYSTGVSGPIPPHSSIYVYYAKYRVVATGDLYFMTPACVKTNVTRVTAKVPTVATKGWIISSVPLPHDGDQ
ncbi:MAG TPA: hypothetical protein VF323_00715 [Candidatus Limnocylindrales bacterium]